MGHRVTGKGKDWEVRNSGSMRQVQEMAKEMDQAGIGLGYEEGKKGIGKIVVGIAIDIGIVGVARRNKRVQSEFRKDKGCTEEPKHSSTGSG
jgi:hypothetical protein